MQALQPQLLGGEISAKGESKKSNKKGSSENPQFQMQLLQNLQNPEVLLEAHGNQTSKKEQLTQLVRQLSGIQNSKAENPEQLLGAGENPTLNKLNAKLVNNQLSKVPVAVNGKGEFVEIAEGIELEGNISKELPAMMTSNANKKMSKQQKLSYLRELASGNGMDKKLTDQQLRDALAQPELVEGEVIQNKSLAKVSKAGALKNYQSNLNSDAVIDGIAHGEVGFSQKHKAIEGIRNKHTKLADSMLAEKAQSNSTLGMMKEKIKSKLNQAKQINQSNDQIAAKMTANTNKKIVKIGAHNNADELQNVKSIFIDTKNMKRPPSVDSLYQHKSMFAGRAKSDGANEIKEIEQMNARVRSEGNNEASLNQIMNQRSNSQSLANNATVNFTDAVPTTDNNAIIKEISDYIVQSQFNGRKSIELNVKHQDLGQFLIKVNHLQDTMHAKDPIQLVIVTTTENGNDFFKTNQSSLLGQIAKAGISVADFKLDNNFEGSQDFRGNNQNSQNQYSESSNNQNKQGRERRNELWQKARERMG